MLNRRMPNGTYWWCERGIKFPLLDLFDTVLSVYCKFPNLRFYFSKSAFLPRHRGAFPKIKRQQPAFDG